jgi:hypothetical protein
MTADQFAELQSRIRVRSPGSETALIPLANGGSLIRVTQVALGSGWNRPTAEVLFVAPPGYPSAAPDCFWVQPGGLRLSNGATPQGSNDSNPIPGDNEPGRKTTWFSWHVKGWNPNRNSLWTYYLVILDRLRPAR